MWALVIIGIIIFVIFVGGSSKSNYDTQYEELLLYCLYNKAAPDIARQIKKNHRIWGHDKSAVLGRLQIMRDSLEIANRSKKPDVADNRLQLAKESINMIIDMRSRNEELVPPETMNKIIAYYNERVISYSTDRYINEAEGYIQKAMTLKTEKSKEKYLQLAQQTLEKGLKDSDAESTLIKLKLEELEDFKQL